MAKDIVNVRLETETLRRLDEAVARGVFASRSEALRHIVRRFLEEHPEQFRPPVLESLLQGPGMTDAEFADLMDKMFRGTPVAEVVAEGRDRF